jgi:anaerobic nitric oxide reductase transcription regulator
MELDNFSKPSSKYTGKTLRETIENFQRQEILRAVEIHSGNWSAAARSLGTHRSNLHNLAKRLGIK